MTTALAQPRTGRECVLSKELLGVLLRVVASRFNIALDTLQRREAYNNLIEPTGAKWWRAALATLA